MGSLSCRFDGMARPRGLGRDRPVPSGGGIISAHFERANLDSVANSTQVDRVLNSLGRLAEVFQSWNASVETGHVSRSGRDQRLADITRSIRSSDWEEASTLLYHLALEYPDDPAHETLKNECRPSRLSSRQTPRRASGCQDVNDPERVLELYQRSCRSSIPANALNSNASLRAGF